MDAEGRTHVVGAREIVVTSEAELTQLIERVLAAPADPYACLGLPAGAATSSVRARYLALALRLHPDKATDEPRAREAFEAVDASFRQLRESRRW